MKCYESSVGSKFCRLCVCHFLFSYPEETCSCHASFSHLLSDDDVSFFILEWSISLPRFHKDCYQTVWIYNCPSLVWYSRRNCIWGPYIAPLVLSAVDGLTKRKALIVHRPPTLGNMIGSAVLPMISVSKPYTRAVRVVFSGSAEGFSLVVLQWSGSV